MCSYLLAFQANLALTGIWLGMVIGTGGYDLLQLLNLYLTDLDELALHIIKSIKDNDHLAIAKIEPDFEHGQH